MPILCQCPGCTRPATHTLRGMVLCVHCGVALAGPKGPPPRRIGQIMRRRLVWIQGAVPVVTYQIQLFVVLIAEVYLSKFGVNAPIGTRRDFSGTWTG